MSDLIMLQTMKIWSCLVLNCELQLWTSKETIIKINVERLMFWALALWQSKSAILCLNSNWQRATCLLRCELHDLSMVVNWLNGPIVKKKTIFCVSSPTDATPQFLFKRTLSIICCQQWLNLNNILKVHLKYLDKSLFPQRQSKLLINKML